MSKKIALVLEGGGMRGAYTAGCLSWLVDNGIEFDSAYGISTGAVHLTTFLMKDVKMLYHTSTRTINDKGVIGLKPLLKEGAICSYNYLFNIKLKKELEYDIKNVYTNCDAHYGVYDLSQGKTIYLPLKDMNMNILKACCTLPIIGHIVIEGDHEYLDGGITKMIPIEKAVEDNNTDYLIITTKPLDYIRKPAKDLVVKLMAKVYKKCPTIANDYKNRHLNYQKQIDLIKKIESTGHLFYRYPSQTIDVSRLRGKTEDLIKLYELGRKDMEDNKEAILKIIKK